MCEAGTVALLHPSPLGKWQSLDMGRGLLRREHICAHTSVSEVGRGVAVPRCREHYRNRNTRGRKQLSFRKKGLQLLTEAALSSLCLSFPKGSKSFHILLPLGLKWRLAEVDCPRPQRMAKLLS